MTEEKPKYTRIIDTITGPWEKRNLPKMAAALPQWVTPDLLTLLGLIAAVLIFTGYILTWYSKWWILLTNFALVLHWYGDSLDGTLARVRKIERERYGYFVDHTCDVITIFLLCIGLGFSPFANIATGLLLATTYFALNIYVHIATYTENTFQLSYSFCGPTEVRIVVIIANSIAVLWNPLIGTFQGFNITVMDIACLLLSLIFILIFFVVSIKDAIKLNLEY